MYQEHVYIGSFSITNVLDRCVFYHLNYAVMRKLIELQLGNKLMHLPGLAVRGGQSVRGGQQERAQDRGREEEDDS